MTGFSGNIGKMALANTNFRQVVFTGQHTQLVVMSLAPGEDIGKEVHEVVDQFIRIESGRAKAQVNGEETELENGSAVVIPAGTEHNIINLSQTEPLKLYTLYSPPHHKDGTVHKTKQDAQADSGDQI